MYKTVQFPKSVRIGTYGTTVVQVWLEVHFDVQSSLYVPVWSVYPGCGHCIEFVISGCCQQFVLMKIFEKPLFAQCVCICLIVCRSV